MRIDQACPNEVTRSSDEDTLIVTTSFSCERRSEQNYTEDGKNHLDNEVIHHRFEVCAETVYPGFPSAACPPDALCFTASKKKNDS
jgi:hypothetical protein